MVGAAVTTAWVLLAWPVIGTLPTADAPLQQWDSVFHLNAVAVVRETGVATPLGGLAPLYGDATIAPYYPTGWHAIVALGPGASVPALTNVAILVLGAGVWVLGLTGLAREVFLHRTTPTVLAPLLAATFVAPLVQITALAQFPNALSNALLPGALLLTVRAVRAASAGQGGLALAGAAAAAVAGLAGTVVAHASGVFSAMILVGPLMVGALGAWAAHLWRTGHRLAGTGVLAAVVTVVIGGPVVLANLDALATVVGFEREGQRTYEVAVRQLLLDQTLSRGFPGDGWQHVAVTAATLVGAALTLTRRRHRWLTASYAVAVGLAVLAHGPEGHPLRWLASFWYTQAGRIAPVAVVPAVLLAAYALGSLVAVARRWASAPVVGHLAMAGVIAIVGVSALARIPLAERVVTSVYVPEQLAWGTMATTDELAMMHRLAGTLPDDAVVVGDPLNGSALLPAVAGVDVVFPQLGPALSPAQVVLEKGLARIHEDPRVCAALDEVGATHLYQDAARREPDGAKVIERTAGMWDVDVSSGFTEVDSADLAAVYRIDMCGNG